MTGAKAGAIAPLDNADKPARASGAGWTLENGDAFELLRALPDASVDVTLGDPPYSEHVENGQAVSGRRSGQAVIRKSKIGVDFLTAEQVDFLLTQLCRVTRRWIGLFCAFEQIGDYKKAAERAGGRYVRCCAWEKPDSTPQLTGDRPATWGECLVILYANTADALEWNGGGKRGLYRAGVCRGAERATHIVEGLRASSHPTQKPLGLMRQLVADFTDEGDSVLDPFAGSGTTLIAAAQLGRTAIGFEKKAHFYELALRRLRGEATHTNPAQPELFT